VEQYRHVPALPRNGARQRPFVLFIFLPIALPIPIRAALSLLTPPDDIIVVISHKEEEYAPCLDDALRERCRTKQLQHQQRCLALALSPAQQQRFYNFLLLVTRPQPAKPDARASTREDAIPRRAGCAAPARLGGTRAGERCG
jgi:hypothetical protein